MVSCIHYNLNPIFFLTFEFITCSVDIHLQAFGFDSRIKSQSIISLPRGSELIYWTLGLQGEVHSIWDVWMGGLQECKDDLLLESGEASNSCRLGPQKKTFLGDCPRVSDRRPGQRPDTPPSPTHMAWALAPTGCGGNLLDSPCHLMRKKVWAPSLGLGIWTPVRIWCMFCGHTQCYH